MMTGFTCRTQTALELLSALDSGNNAQVRSEAGDIMEHQWQTLVQAVERAEVGNTHGTRAQQFRGLIEEELIDQTFAKTLAQVALDLVSSLLKFAQSPQMSEYVSNATKHISSISSQLKSAASQADSYASLMGATGKIISSTDRLLGSTGSSASDAKKALKQGTAGVKSLDEALAGVSTSMSSSLSDAAGAYDTISKQVDTAFSDMGSQSSQITDKLTTLQRNIQSQADTFGTYAEALRSLADALELRIAERTRDLHLSNSELQAKERHLQVILAAAPVGVIELDDDERCRFINVNGCVLTSCTQEEARGRALLDFVHPDDREYVAFVFKINRLNDSVHWIEFRLDRTNQRCSAHWINVAGGDSAQNSTIMVLTSATARAQQDERLWTLAHHDTLTDLPNRNLFWDRMGQALRYAKRHESGAAVLWIDLDGFKGVNDRFGHAAGDLLLQQVAQRLRGRIRESDTVARMGGDEFAVIMPDISDAADALHTAGALVTSLAEPFGLPQGEARISGSVGVALYPQHADGVESLTQCADMAMYQAKNAGKNQVRLWSEQKAVG